MLLENSVSHVQPLGGVLVQLREEGRVGRRGLRVIEQIRDPLDPRTVDIRQLLAGAVDLLKALGDRLRVVAVQKEEVEAGSLRSVTVHVAVQLRHGLVLVLLAREVELPRVDLVPVHVLLDENLDSFLADVVVPGVVRRASVHFALGGGLDRRLSGLHRRLRRLLRDRRCGRLRAGRLRRFRRDAHRVARRHGLDGALDGVSRVGGRAGRLGVHLAAERECDDESNSHDDCGDRQPQLSQRGALAIRLEAADWLGVRKDLAVVIDHRDLLGVVGTLVEHVFAQDCSSDSPYF